MKKLLFIFSLFSFCLFSCQSEMLTVKEIKDGKVISVEGKSVSIPDYDNPEATTFVVVRHAEKMETTDDPELSEEGKARAENLANILTGCPLTLATSTSYKRTTQTANPTVFVQKCDIAVYGEKNMATRFADILDERKGQKVLVIGHSNTVPELLNLFSGKTVYTNIPHEDYDRFYIATMTELGNASIQEFRY